ncbi:fimbrial protein [Pseudomonas sp. FSL R10-0056]|jgi:minor fimbrial subunit|uniref:Fimbrial protein n=3 Tax=Pseudomonas TaxID=286 RepID=A0A266NTC7_PSEFR|nr:MULTISPECIES: fimbrial protein [Pseudomonas]MBO4970314.1 fimbrial protein [Pseudomonas sp.]MBO5394203.1 fimbrial protein [Pseudomonas sp.]MBO6279935.1 fimbrial protein [Pseudomonas sp.]MBP3861145.1 fimbrial protein [Pseudomonas sp.]MDA7023168.1 fimbrial protein [Pseudomonas fragi]
MKLSLTLAATLFAGLLSSTANAVTDTVTINLSGTLTRPPCNLTSSKTLTANFGSLRYDQVADAALIDIPLTMTCPANSVLAVSILAARTIQGSTTQASTGKTNLAYSLLWNSDSTAANITGTKRNLTNQSGTVDLSMKAKLIALGALTEGAFSTSAVISIEYL